MTAAHLPPAPRVADVEAAARPTSLLTSLLTSSRARCFRECPRLHQFKYLRGIRPVRESEALRFGTLVHVGLEAYWLAIQRWQEDSTIIEAKPDEAALNAVSGRGANAFEQVRAEEMLAEYAARWRVRDELEYGVLAVEPRFECALINPETMHPSRTTRLAGKIDVVVRRRSDGRCLVVEHKTTSDDVRGDDADYWARLAMDHQCSFYVLGAESLGWQVDEILYDVLVKPQQRPKLATPVEERKFTKAGALYATQREFDESPDEYRARVREALVADPSRYLSRKAVPRSNSQVQDFLFDAWQQAATMRESERTGRAPRNPDACLRFGRCPFFSVCSTGADPAEYPAEFQVVADVHPELQGNA